jgi:hypothetical protein
LPVYIYFSTDTVHVVFVIATIIAVGSLLLALALPASLSPTRPLTQQP